MTKPTIADRSICDAYLYLLGRLLVLRQQQLDFQEGFTWNALVHRRPGDVQWPNPNLDVAYSEAWVAVDERSGLIERIVRAMSIGNIGSLQASRAPQDQLADSRLFLRGAFS